ncbi:putative transcriptional elongation regulator Elc1/Elongin C [Choiromyces venosus 120613-1]|uniref:Elongin-C n=1 Tax=Choiromyces venosus 120613-1 TaxID=1336337 RepID=A0A3N4K5R0_9PEZI|nr:putative transcriptional elongation regulator Elc1/Elongin C [Choiromyces venosus 120613-1]
MSTPSPEDQNSILLVSNDAHTFILRKSSVLISPAIKSMLDKKSNFEEAQFNRVVFKNMNGVVLEKVCEYFYYREKYADAVGDVPDMEIPPELALELLMVADFLCT